MINVDKKFLEFCEKLGRDSSFVQGAGGNVSIKDDKNLYVKGSGKWISNALKENIFAVLPLKESQGKLYATNMEHNFSNDSLNSLRPSIETSFHLLIDSKIIVHLHETFSLSILILKKYKSIFRSILPHNFSYIFVDYVKPGKDLAKSIKLEMNQKRQPDIVFLQNHGIILCGDNIDEIDNKIKILRKCTQRFINENFKTIDTSSLVNDLIPADGIKILDKNYYLISQETPCTVCNNKSFLKHLDLHWAFAPDHVVFLGKHAHIFNSIEDVSEKNCQDDLIFIKQIGIFYAGKNPLAVIDQLECFKNVFMNILEGRFEINTLDELQIKELLNWSDEKFRQSIAK